MVYQNGGKFERLKKMIKNVRFIQITIFFSRKIISCYEESDETTKKLTFWAL